MIVKVAEQEYYLDRWLVSNLDFIMKDIRDDSDAVVVVDGLERGGKSVLAMQIGFYVDPSLTLDRVTFTPAEFKRAVLAAPKYSVVIFDEAISGLRAGRWAAEINQSLIELLATIGQKNLCIILAIPSFFELMRYPAIHRSVGLIHVFRNKEGRRGQFVLYDAERKKRLYLLGRKGYDYGVVRSNFGGRFVNHYVLDEQAYRLKKLKALTDNGQMHEPALLVKTRSQRDGLIKYLVNDKGFSLTEVSKGMRLYCPVEGLSRMQVTRIVRGEALEPAHG